MTQGEIEKLGQKTAKIFSELELRIMSDIVRRIKINGFSTSSADWQFTRLQQLGKSEEDIKKWVQEALEASDEELERIFSEDAYKEHMGFGRAYEIYGLEQIPFEENIPLQRLIEATKKQISTEFNNMANSMGFAIKGSDGNVTYSPLLEFYRSTMDNAVIDIQSGAFSYQRVLERTVRKMTASGVRWVDYDSGWHNRVDVAARRAVLTGFRQVQGHINEQIAADLKTDFYEVTYHVGARPTHQPWQGKVWNYKELQEVCGLGTVTGLHGANCYHDYIPFIPGASVRTYTDEQLERMIAEENTPKEYDGKQYTTYEALQQQRKMETSMRSTRQEIKLLQDGGGDDTSITLKKAKYYGQMQKYEDFSKKMDLPLQKQRILQDGLKGTFSDKRAYDRLQLTKAEKELLLETRAQNAKFSERIKTYNNGQKDVITNRRLLNNLNKSQIGKETIEYIISHPELEIQMCYNIDHDEDIRGRQFGDTIQIFASDTKTVQTTAETIIHEITHHRYNIGETQWAECVCFAQELKHQKQSNELTFSELKDIIKSVKKLYSEYSWR